MEKLPHWTESFLYLPSSTTTTTVSSATPPLSAALYDRNYYPATANSPYLKPPHLKLEAGSSLPPSQAREVEEGGGERSASDIEGIKAKIMSHPRYSNLIGAYLDCQKEVTEFLKGVESEFNALTNTCSFRLFSSGRCTG
ncbi:hypothetical protein GW17_00006162 [Ensete ventricosum]|nr:hypothetical protein GW17_00006162 [Ensete ventricosum]